MIIPLIEIKKTPPKTKSSEGQVPNVPGQLIQDLSPGAWLQSQAPASVLWASARAAPALPPRCQHATLLREAGRPRSHLCLQSPFPPFFLHLGDAHLVWHHFLCLPSPQPSCLVSCASKEHIPPCARLHLLAQPAPHSIEPWGAQHMQPGCRHHAISSTGPSLLLAVLLALV